MNKVLLAVIFIAAFAPAGFAAAASFYISPAAASAPAGAEFTADIMLRAEQAINAAQGTLTFPPDRLQVVRVSKAGSLLRFWSEEPSFSNSQGILNFGGGLPSPGFTGSNGLVLRITFRARNPGIAAVSMAQGAILANDGRGTDVSDGIARAVYTVTPLVPVVATGPSARRTASGTQAQAEPKIELLKAAQERGDTLDLEGASVLISLKDPSGSLSNIAVWSAIIFALILLLAALVSLTLTAWARFRVYRLKLRKEIVFARIELIRDLDKAVRDLEARADGTDRQNSEELDILTRNIGKELEQLRKDVG